MRVFIRRNRYAIGACALALAAVALFGFYGITQANAAEDATADANVEQRWEGDAEAPAADDKAADPIEAPEPESAAGTESPATDGSVNMEVDGGEEVEEIYGETAVCNVAVDDGPELDGDAEEARAYLIEDEASASSEYLEINASSYGEAEHEERPTA